jgi:hypothetical protein
VKPADSPEKILEALGGLFTRSSKLISELMDPIKKHKEVPTDDWPSRLGYLSMIKDVLKEAKQSGVFDDFCTDNNVEAILEKMPNDMMRKWLDQKKSLTDDQRGPAFYRFIIEE